MGLIKNGVLNRKQNKSRIGLKNYYVLTVQQQSAEFPTKSSRFESQWEHIPYKTFISYWRVLRYVYIWVYLLTVLVEECISDMAYWYGLQVLSQYLTQF